MCDKSINTWSLGSVRDWYKAQEICDRVVSENPFMLISYANIYKTQKIIMKLLMIIWQH